MITATNLALLAAKIWSTRHLKGDDQFSWEDAIICAMELYKQAERVLKKERQEKYATR
jgi:hypothetical protein